MARKAQLVLVTAREDEKLIGIAPLFISEYDGQSALLLIGSIEISDYLDLIVRMDDHARFITGLLDFLASFPTRQLVAVSIGITSPIHLPPSPRSKRNPHNAAGLISKRCIAPPRASP